ncbi:MAG: DUF4382 domain-containing protein [Rhizobacter sp.]|nr:DUF4382 domain-containing protein [Rhizobacter sp.]
MHHTRTSQRPRTRLLAFQLACAAAILAACGGGGSAGTSVLSGTSAQSIALQTYITDNLATDYSKVWVSIEKITAVDANDVEATLLDASSAPVVVNLSSLASVGQLLSTASLQPGVYHEVRVTLVNSVQLVSLDGATTTTAKLAATGSDFVIHVDNLALDPGASGQLVLDFNLARFTYDANSGLVVPVVEAPKPSDAFGKFVHQQASVNGIVKSVDVNAQTITVDDDHLGAGIVVSLATDAVIVDEASGLTVTLAGVAAGAHVEIRGTVKPGATAADPVTVVASVVHIERALPPVAVQTVAAAGNVKAVNGTLVTVALHEATFLPGADGVVVDISSASFTHGAAGNLAPGVAVAFRGTLSGSGTSTVVLATDIDVLGAPSQLQQQLHPELKFNAVNGAIAAVNVDGTFTVTQAKADGPVAVATYTIDASHATYLAGNASCVTVGAVVQAIGVLANQTLEARFLNIQNCAGQVHAEPAPATTPTEPGPTTTSGDAPK